jgi:hypothetical protein
MLSKTYEDVEAKAFLQWRLLLAQTTMEYYENVQVSELAPFNLVTVPFSLLNVNVDDRALHVINVDVFSTLASSRLSI